MDQWPDIIANTISKTGPTNNIVNNIAHKNGELLITHTKDWWTFISEFVLIGGSLCALALMFKQLLASQNSDTKKQKRMAEDMKRVLLEKMLKYGRNIEYFETSSYEDQLLSMVVLPEMIDVRFSDIGGLNEIKGDLMETVLVPLIYPQLTRASKLCAPPLGVLFYGEPGTGKTMMAKAIAVETNATFFNVDMSRLMSKWYGDSQKFISALFSLARKMAPSIIWIDEIDALFAHRSSTDHHADIYNKALFLSLWDGLCSDIYNSDSCAQVIILGATNRPQAVDGAFLRRMSRQYQFSMPDKKTRKLILKILLNTENIHSNVDLTIIANQSAQYSGSDLKELCKYAATLPLREYVRRANKQSNDNRITPMGDGLYGTPDGQLFTHLFENQNFNLRCIEMQDLEIALTHIKSTVKAQAFHQHKYGQKKNVRDNLFSLFARNGFGYESCVQKQDENHQKSNINIIEDEDTESSILEVE